MNQIHGRRDHGRLAIVHRRGFVCQYQGCADSWIYLDLSLHIPRIEGRSTNRRHRWDIELPYQSIIVTAEKQTGSIIYKQLLAASFYVEIDKTEAARRISSNSQVQIIHLYLGTKICLLPLIAISIWTLNGASAMQVLALHFNSFSMASYSLYSRASSSSRAPFSGGYLLSVQKLLSSFDDKRLTKNTLKGVKRCLARPKRFWPSLHIWGHCQYSAFV